MMVIMVSFDSVVMQFTATGILVFLMFTFSNILFQHNMPKQYTCKPSKPKNIALKYKDKDKVLKENI